MSSTRKSKRRARQLDKIRKYVSVPCLLSPLPGDTCFSDQSSNSSDGNRIKSPVISAAAVVDDNLRFRDRIKQLKEVRLFYRLPKLLKPLTENHRPAKIRKSKRKETSHVNKSKSVEKVAKTISIDDIRPFYGLPRLISPLSSDDENDNEVHCSATPRTTTIEIAIEESDIVDYYENLRKKKEWDLRKKKEKEEERHKVTEENVPQQSYEDLKQEVFGLVLPSKPLTVSEPGPEHAEGYKPSATPEKKLYRTQRDADEIYNSGLLFSSAHDLLKIVTKNKPLLEATRDLNSWRGATSKVDDTLKNTNKSLSTTSRNSLVSSTSTATSAHLDITNLSYLQKCPQSSCNSSETYSLPPSPFPLLSPGTPSSLCTSGSSVSTSETTSVSTLTNSSVRRRRVISVDTITRRLLRKQKFQIAVPPKEMNYSDYISDYRSREKVKANGHQLVKEKVMNWNINYENVLTPPTPLNIPDDFETPPSSPKAVNEKLFSNCDITNVNAPSDKAQLNSVNGIDYSFLLTPEEYEMPLYPVPYVTETELDDYLDSMAAESTNDGNQDDTDDFLNSLCMI